MLNSEVIFPEFVTGTSDFGGKILKYFTKKNATRFFGNLRSVAEGNNTIFFFGLIGERQVRKQDMMFLYWCSRLR